MRFRTQKRWRVKLSLRAACDASLEALRPAAAQHACVGSRGLRLCAAAARARPRSPRRAPPPPAMRGLKKLTLSLSDIKALLAHRPPFLFLASARHNVAGERVTARLAPPPAPSPPPRGVLLEALGQAGALVVRQHGAYAHEPLPAFAAMRDVRFRPWPAGAAPDAGVDLRAELVRARRARFGVVKAQALVDGVEEPVCSAEFVFSFLESGGKEMRKGL